MVFSTQFDARDRVFSHAGDRIKQLYDARVDNQGHIDLVESGTEDLYDYIQSFKESCDINTMSLSPRRAWIEILEGELEKRDPKVALPSESVD